MHLYVEGVEVRFPSGRRVGPLSLSAERGVWWVRGPNGCGKTTLLRCIAGEQAPTRGVIRVDGQDPWVHPAARAKVSMLTTLPELPDHLRVDEAWRLMAGVRGAPGWPGGPLRDALDLPGDLPLAAASAGQRRRAELLAALAGDPPVLLLDEVFATLDTRGAALVAGWLDAARRSRLIVVTGHAAMPLEVDEVVDLPDAAGP